MTVLTKAERKARDERNRIVKLVPGRSRLYRLMNIGELMQAEADIAEREDDRPRADLEGIRNDGLFLARLAHDLLELRRTVRPEVPRGPGRHWDERWDVRP